MWIVTSDHFEKFIIAAICLNSLFLGMKDYTDVDNVTPLNVVVEYA